MNADCVGCAMHTDSSMFHAETQGRRVVVVGWVLNPRVEVLSAPQRLRASQQPSTNNQQPPFNRQLSSFSLALPSNSRHNVPQRFAVNPVRLEKT